MIRIPSRPDEGIFKEIEKYLKETHGQSVVVNFGSDVQRVHRVWRMTQWADSIDVYVYGSTKTEVYLALKYGVV